ncbi:hypothetical protein DFR55_12215 [Herbinix hemicellulosilytica]|mgnify:FL=1|uniref:Uncharacterized protein n=1 Tax=Herbinix hemicellulosilytica TaxID=1564487 RepID=A0A0H5SE69_HERHM|nr:hypothetical protein [Herbinix hemicellulosilytica]RBP57500.1 hypothetical protein DFR55_12215 [Herbinix hemicellulosilytica]CRZ33727.1 hypothetical protein HHT355_0522 [Herbinix hemicellulosilytica]
MVCVGFLGTEAFDIILYIGHTLAKLKYPVLIVDLSDSGALKNVIYHGMDLDSMNEIVHYRNLNYIRKVPGCYELNEYKDGAVLISFGYSYRDIRPLKLDYMNIVVNPFTHVMNKVAGIMNDTLPNDIKLKLIVRDILSPDDLETVKNSINMESDPDSISYLYLDFKDYENALRCQQLQTVNIRKVSKRMKKLVTGEVKYIVSKLNGNGNKVHMASDALEGEGVG